jgi:hypothetical protein
LARTIHQQWTTAPFTFDFSSNAPAELRRWVKESTGLDPEISISRPWEEADRFQPIGAWVMDLNGTLAVGIAYMVDSRPVTLLVTRKAALEDPPSEELFSKKITYHIEAGVKALTWSQDGVAYALVTDLSGYGQQSCFICHTDEKRRRSILRLSP